MHGFRAASAAVLVAGLAVPGALAQRSPEPAQRLQITVDTIMRGHDLVGWPPEALRWSGDSERLYFEWRRPGEKESSTYVVRRSGGEPQKLPEEEARNSPPAEGRWDRAGKRLLAVENGDIVIYDDGGRTRNFVTRTAAAESRPRWTRQDSAITYVRDGNLFLVPLDPAAGFAVKQLTDVASRRPERRLPDSQRYIQEEEEQLIQYLRNQKAERQRAEDKAKATKLPAFDLLEGQTAVDLMLSPDESSVFILVAERPAGARSTIVPRYVTRSGYTEEVTARNNVGDTQERRLLAVLDLRAGTSVWADASFAPAAGDEKPPEGAPGQPAAAGETRRPGREVRWSMPIVSADGRYAVASARSADNKERWLVTLDPATGRTTVVDLLRDEAWVREAALGGGTVEFLPDNRRIAFLSERDGWMHLYTLDLSVEGASPRQLTSGRWEVASAEVSRGGGRFYITTNEVHPGERHVYSLSFDGGDRIRLTSMPGSNEAVVSPDDSTMAIVHSYSNRPPDLYLMANRAGSQARQITTTPTAEWRRFNWIDPRLVTYRARDGVEVHARLYTPDMIGARRDPSRPGVVFVHGAGYLQNAHRYWSTYFREYMFHNLLASRGYVVLDVDYRASAGYGRDWRTAIYRHMGSKDLEDVVDGARYLVAREQVNPRRIGVYGGSYGGFITLMAMFTTPDVFAAGAALRPVTDWAHYNHGYTSNILNVPQRDREAYRRSSPIYFAEGLKGALLICHGMVDTNVHFQDSVRLVQRLIELRKENWELAVYPVENHAFTEETSWADEYKRILKLFEQNLRGASPPRATN